MWTYHTTTVKGTIFGVIDGYYSNRTKTCISVIARNIPIVHDPSRKIYIQCYNFNNLFMHKGQDQVNIVEVYLSTKTYVSGTQRTVSLKHPKHMFKLMGKKIFTILR